MPYPPDYRAQKRDELIRAARGLFSEKGFEAVTIDELMGAAGLTRGGFYGYFGSKSELYALAMGCGEAAFVATRDEITAAETARQLIETYLSPQHSEEANGRWPILSLPRDTAESDEMVRRVFETVFLEIVSILEDSLEGKHRAVRNGALAIAALCVGARAISRALCDVHLGTELRSAAMRIALALNGGSSGSVPPPRVGKLRARAVGDASRPRAEHGAKR